MTLTPRFDDRPIGIFDSGIGGLTVAREIERVMPDEGYIYFGDTARVPYGAKSAETVTRYARQITAYLLTQGVKAVVIACNTVSANSYDALKAEFDVPIFEMVGEGVKCALTTKNGKVGVIGTEATIRSGAYERAIKAADGSIEVFSKACPLFVPLAEEGWTGNDVARAVCEEYLSPMSALGIDTLVLACTHYPLLEGVIKAAMAGVNVVNPAKDVAESVKAALSEAGATHVGQGAKRFCVSDDTSKFAPMCKLVLGREQTATKVSLDT